MVVAVTPRSVFADVREKMFERIAVELLFAGRLVGGCPKDPKLVQGWLRKGMGLTDEDELFYRARQHLLEMGEALDEEARRRVESAVSMEDLFAVSEKLAGELQTQGFKRDENGDPYIEGRQIKAGIKESVNILFAKQKWGATGKGPKNFTAERVFVSPDQIRVGSADDVQVDLAIGHVNGAKGPQSTIGYYEYVERPSIEFEILQLVAQNPRNGGRSDSEPEPALTNETWGRVFAHLELNGLGAMRSQGFGQFVTVRFDRID